ncbi:Auxin-induced protein X10A [Nymphaea thermarum]|nr:Auxin-induced protein X10A [Nymphaea thermarum]
MSAVGSDDGRSKQIVRLRSVLRPWNSFTGGQHQRESLLTPSHDDTANRPAAVPKGYLAVYVGSESRRFVIPMAFLRHAEFRALLARAEEEFGFEHEGGLTLPCEVDEFEELVAAMARRERGRSTCRKKAALGSLFSRSSSFIGLLAAVPSLLPHARPSLAASRRASNMLFASYTYVRNELLDGGTMCSTHSAVPCLILGNGLTSKRNMISPR